MAAAKTPFNKLDAGRSRAPNRIGRAGSPRILIRRESRPRSRSPPTQDDPALITPVRAYEGSQASCKRIILRTQTPNVRTSPLCGRLNPPTAGELWVCSAQFVANPGCLLTVSSSPPASMAVGPVVAVSRRSPGLLSASVTARRLTSPIGQEESFLNRELRSGRYCKAAIVDRKGIGRNRPVWEISPTKSRNSAAIK